MYCKDCRNYNEKSLDNCRKKGQTSPLRKADDLECFDNRAEAPLEEADSMLTCTRCGRVLPADMFGERKKKGGSGTIRMKVCRECMRESSAAGGKKQKMQLPAREPEKQVPRKPKRPIKATVPAGITDLKPKVEESTTVGALRSYSDAALVEELKRRGWKGNLVKSLEI